MGTVLMEAPETAAEPSKPLPSWRRRVVKINLLDEDAIAQLPGVSFITARRLCMERPFSQVEDLLAVRGISRSMLQEWEAGGIDLAFDDPFLALESEAARQRVTTSAPHATLQSAKPTQAPRRPPLPSPTPNTSHQRTISLSVTPRPPLPRPRDSDVARLPAPAAQGDEGTLLHSHGRDENSPVRGHGNTSWHTPISKSAPIEASSPSNVYASLLSAPQDVEKLVELVYRQQDARLRRIAVSRMVRVVTLVIQGWRNLLLERRRFDEVEFKIILRQLRISLKDNFRQWLACVRKSARLRTLGVSLLMRVLARYRAHAFMHWHSAVDSLTELGTRYATLLERYFTRCMRAAWTSWHHLCRNQKRLRSAGVMVLFRWLRVNLCRIVKVWHNHAVLGEAIAMMRTRNEALRVGRCLRLSLNYWQSSSSMKATQHLKRNFVKTIRGVLLSAFDRWSWGFRRRTHLQETGLHILAMRLQHKLVAIFCCWKRSMRYGSHLRRTGVKILLRWLSTTVRHVFQQWRNLQYTTVSWGDVLLKIGLEWTTAVLSTVFRQWRDASALIRAREIHFVRAQRRVIWNGKRNTIRRWAGYTYEARRLWHTGSIILSRWAHSVLSACFSSWVHYRAWAKQIAVHISTAFLQHQHHAFYSWQLAWHEANFQNATPNFLSPPSPPRPGNGHANDATAARSSHLAGSIPSSANATPQRDRDIRGSFTTGQAGPEAHAGVVSEDNDSWGRVLSALSAQQRTEMHMLAVKRTWAVMEGSFAAWSSVRAWRKSKEVAESMHSAPPEPDHPPPENLTAQRVTPAAANFASEQLGLDGTPRLIVDGNTGAEPQNQIDDDNMQVNVSISSSSGSSQPSSPDDEGSPRACGAWEALGSAPDHKDVQLKRDVQISSTHSGGGQRPNDIVMGDVSILSKVSLSASHASSLAVPAVVMSNYPRQQFNDLEQSTEEGENPAAAISGLQQMSPDVPSSPATEKGVLAPQACPAGKAASVHASVAKAAAVFINPNMIMSPQNAGRGMRSSRDSFEERNTKLGKPVTQSLFSSASSTRNSSTSPQKAAEEETDPGSRSL